MERLLDHDDLGLCLTCSCVLLFFHSTSAVSTTTCRLQGGCHGVSCAAWSCATIPERSCLCLPTCLVVADFARRHHINCLFHHSGSQPSVDEHYQFSVLLAFAASLLWNSLASDIQSSASLPVFCQHLKHSFFTILPQHSSVTLLRLRGLCNSSAVLATFILTDTNVD